MKLVCFDDHGVLPLGEGLLLHVGVELVAPAQATALAGPALDAVGDDGPVLGAVLPDQAAQQVILLQGAARIVSLI